MTLGHGIAIAGIWIGVGATSFSIGSMSVFVAICAVLATMIVVAN